MTREHLDGFIAEARAAHDNAKANNADEPGLIDDMVKLLADMEALGDHISV